MERRSCPAASLPFVPLLVGGKPPPDGFRAATIDPVGGQVMALKVGYVAEALQAGQ